MNLQVLTLKSIKYLVTPLKSSIIKSDNFGFVPYIQLRCYSQNEISKSLDILDSLQWDKFCRYIRSNNFGGQPQFLNYKKLIELTEERKSLVDNIRSLEVLSVENDAELNKLLEAEKKQYLQSLDEINSSIIYQLVAHEQDKQNARVYILPGIGGEESKLFSKELHEMYLNYADFKNWDCFDDSKDGGLLVEGEYVYSFLKHEGGVHRVQRVPETEKLGRVHTSTCSVVVLPVRQKKEIELKKNNLTIEKMRSSGPGGQNVNKRESCVRVKHIPTGIVVENQRSRFQYRNLEEAIDKLKNTLINMEDNKIKDFNMKLAKEQAGTKDYSDKIRTYHYPQNRVTDHRINYTISNLRGFLSGGGELDYVIQLNKELSMKKKLINVVENITQSVDYKKFEREQKNELCH